jgi:cytochrome c oxidase subunit I
MATVAGEVSSPATHEPSGIWSWITTVDHKRIAILYGVTAFIFFIIGGLEALLIRLQLAQPNGTVISAETYNQMFTMHGTTMVFLAVMPLSAAFFNYLVPLMIGARDVAFPRLNSMSYWIFLFGALFLNFSFIYGAVPDAGWFGYAPLTSSQFSPGHAIDFWALGLQILGVSSIAASLNFIVTIINLRAPGMTLMRMPVFVWMTLVVSFLIILAFPAITVALFLLVFDRFAGTNFYIAQAGGDPLLWQHLFWIFGHPEVYILILPAMGIVSEVLPTFARKPLFGYQFIVFSGIAIGFLGFGVWSHHMFAVGMGPIPDSGFALATMLIAVPTGVKIFNWIGTLYGGSIRFTTALIFAVGFIGLFIIGGLSGVMHAVAPHDLQQTDSYFVVAHFHYVLFGGSIMGIFSGLYYWFPKMTGRLMSEGLGRLHFWVVFIGFNLTFFPMHFLGLHGMPRRTYTYPEGLGFESINMGATIGAFLMAFGVLIFIYNFAVSLRNGERAGNDPWDGATLEWAISSPPPVYNFAAIPDVHSVRPLWDTKYGAISHGAEALPVPEQRAHVATLTEEQERAVEHLEDHAAEHIHLPSPSFWPVVTALGITLIPAGLVLGLAFSGIGLVVTFIGILSWALEPAG